jgi:hypothetical protein
MAFVSSIEPLSAGHDKVERCVPLDGQLLQIWTRLPSDEHAAKKSML